MGMFKERKLPTATTEKPNEELADAYEAIAALNEQVASLTAQIEALKGGNA